MTNHHDFKRGDEVKAYFREHSIPTVVSGVVTNTGKRYITVKATDGWEGEAGNTVSVPHTDIRLKESS